MIPGRTLPTEPADGDRSEDAGPPSLSYYEPATVSTTFQAEHDGRYQLVLDLTATERYVDGVYDYNRCRLIFKADGEELLRQEFGRQDGKPFRFEFDRDWKAGPHELTFEVEPLTPGEKQVRSLSIRIQSVTVRGPLDERYWVRPAELRPVLPGRRARETPAGRRLYARELLGRFATQGVPPPGGRGDGGPARGAGRGASTPERGGPSRRASPRRWRPCWPRPGSCSARRRSSRARRTGIPLVDEYALASRLSYFLWSSMPDDELFRLAGEHKLRAEPARPRSSGCSPTRGRRSSSGTSSASGSRPATSRRCSINAPAVISRDQPPDPEAGRRRARFRELNRKPPEELTDGREGRAEARPARRSSARSAASANSS